jgi:hypothetical protein
MSMATRTDTQSPALHLADSHDLIRVPAGAPANFREVVEQIRRLVFLHPCPRELA